MANGWDKRKKDEAFAKGRHALRFDYLAGNYNTCPLANVQPTRRRWIKQAREEKIAQEARAAEALAHVLVVLDKRDEGRRVLPTTNASVPVYRPVSKNRG